MWLLYVTFEDFVCLNYPERSHAIISSSVDINKYITQPTVSCRSDKNSRTCGQSETSVEFQCLACSTVTVPKRRRGFSKIGHLKFNPELSAFRVVRSRDTNCLLTCGDYSTTQPALLSRQKLITTDVEPGVQLFADDKNHNPEINEANVLFEVKDIDKEVPLERREPETVRSRRRVRSVSCLVRNTPRSVNNNSKIQTFVRGNGVNQSHPLGRERRDKSWRRDTLGPCSGPQRFNSMEVEPRLITDFHDRWSVANGEAIMKNTDLTHKPNVNDLDDRIMELTQNDKPSTYPGVINDLTEKQRDTQFKELCLGSKQILSHQNTTFRCQAANPLWRPPCQAQRPSILSSADRESRLRVSVFDHTSIPPNLTSGIINACHSRSASSISADAAVRIDSKLTNSSETRQGLEVQSNCAVIRARATSDHPVGTLTQRENFDGSNIENSGKMKSSQFESLLKSLILVGPVDTQDTSPMTISSGYESDYMQTKETEIDDIFCNSGKEKGASTNEIPSSKQEDLPTDYFSMSDNYPKSEVTTLVCSKTGSLPHRKSKWVNSQEKSASTETEQTKTDSKEFVKTKLQSQGHRNQNAEFSYAQRHNYKLTKVTRSMYEIIHDLQNEKRENPPQLPEPPKRRSRKGKKAILAREARQPPQRSNALSSTHDVRGRHNSYSGDTNKTNHRNHLSHFSGRFGDQTKSATGTVLVKCVRRPLGCETLAQVNDRLPPSCASNNKPVTSNSNCDNTDRLQTELRSLLCQPEEMPNCEEGNMPNQNLNRVLGADKGRDECLNDNWRGPPENLNNFEEQSLFGLQSKVDLNENSISRSVKPEDHVYETIPGDELLYEEMEKLRGTSKGTRIRRFTTVPDLPGTFVPKEPPALPERRYLKDSPPPKESVNYLFMGDINSNFPPKMTDRSDSGFASASSDKLFETQTFSKCYPFQEHSAFSVDISSCTRGDETSDGYCSIDNLSLLQEQSRVLSLGTTSLPEPIVQGCSTVFISHNDPENVSGPEHQRRANLYHLFNNKQTRNMLSDSLEIETKLRGIGLLEPRKSDESDSDSTLVSSTFDRNESRRVIQATYV